MGKNSNTIRYETVVQLLLLAVLVLTPYLAFNLTDYLELFSVSKPMGICISFWSSIKQWFSPSYVCLFINFIIFFIAASSSISSNTMGLDPSSPTDSFSESSIAAESLPHDHNHDHDNSKFHTLEDTCKDQKWVSPENTIGLDPSSSTDSFRESTIAAESLPDNDDHDHDHSKFHTMEDTCKDRKWILSPETMVDRRDGEVSPESGVDMRELRKSKTFNGGELRSSRRRERYVRVLSQEELDRRVEAFIYTFKKKKKESNEEGLKLSGIYEPNLAVKRPFSRTKIQSA